jgi:lipoprotein-anchoring transpeptidase ErfK/SrfK
MSFKVKLHILLACVMFSAIAPADSVGAQATSFADSVSATDLDPVLWPVEFGQTELTVFVPQTRHSIQGMILDYWRANGEATVYGNPISEPYGAANGLYSQAFERGVFQYDPDWTMTDNPWIRLAPIGKATVTDQREAKRADGRRVAADRRTEAWTPPSGSDNRSTSIYNEGGRISEVTGFSIAGEFGAWYDSHEGWFYLGEPISEPHAERGVQTQYFENGLLLSNNEVVWVAPLPRENPAQFGIDTSPIGQGDLPDYSEALFVDSQNPFGVDTTNLIGRRSIVVSIADQTLRAYQGNELILETLVSTGLDPNKTETGNFHVRIKRPAQTMSGFTSSTGEVVGVGADGTPDAEGGSSYEVEDVPNVMYFNFDAEALHGAYWHENFGNKMSHGCVNLPLDVAEFLYDWAPLGTAVTVVEDSLDGSGATSFTSARINANFPG